MAENYAIVGFKEIGKTIGNWCMDNRAHILTGLGVTGTIATGVLSAKAGARSARKIDRREAELGRYLTAGEKFKLCAPEFVAPGVSAVIAIGGSVGSDLINTSTIARTNMALIASEKAYEQLRRKTKEVLGEKKEKQVQDEIVKENVEEARTIFRQSDFDNAPRSGNGDLYPYVDDFFMRPFMSNPDYLALHVKSMYEMMKELKARGDEFDFYDKIVGVRSAEWLKGLNFDKKIWNSDQCQEFGWNKGYAEDGSDDDPIGYTVTTMHWTEGFPVNVIHWEKRPTDMRLGRLIKSGGVGL